MAFEYEKEEKTWVLKPDVKKILLRNIFKIVGAAALIIGIFIFLHFMVGLDVFIGILEELGTEVKPGRLLLNFTLGISGLSLLILVVNYFSVKNTRYEFSYDKLVAYETAFMVVINSKETPYKNISRINYNKDGLFNTLFNSGTITLELTGTEEKKMEINFIDNIEETVKKVWQLVQEQKTLERQKAETQQKREKILSGF